ncbi:MAG: hypothetical protein R3C28_00070 [Pirellulaceae bacterium]
MVFGDKCVTNQSQRRHVRIAQDRDEDDDNDSIVGTLAQAAFSAASSKKSKPKPRAHAPAPTAPRQTARASRPARRRPDRSPRYSGFVSFAPPVTERTVVVYESNPAYGSPILGEAYSDPVYRAQAGIDPNLGYDPAYPPGSGVAPYAPVPLDGSALPPEPTPLVGSQWSDSVNLPSPAQSIVIPEIAWTDTWNARFRADYGGDFDQLSRFGFDFLAVADRSFGIDTSVNMNWEELSPFDRDHLWLGDVNLVYELVHTQRFKGRAGAGVQWLADSYGGEAGFNLTLGVDWQIAKRLIATGEVDLGTLGAAEHFHTKATLGYALGDNVEWFASYDHRDIGGVVIDGVSTGLGFRF